MNNFIQNLINFNKQQAKYILLFTSCNAARDVAFMLNGEWDGCNSVTLNKKDEVAINTAARLMESAWCYQGDKSAVLHRLNKDELLQRYRIGERYFANANLRSLNLSLLDLNGINLSWGHLNLVNLSGTDLRKCNLTAADLREANLSDTNLTEAYLVRANFTNANLSRANLRGANLTHACLLDADLSEADLRDANLSYINLNGANLTGTLIDIM